MFDSRYSSAIQRNCVISLKIGWFGDFAIEITNQTTDELYYFISSGQCL
jgi:hypothetical protein